MPGSRIASPQVRFERERSRNNAYAGVQTDRLRDLQALAVRSRPSRAWTLEQEIQHDADEERTRLETGSVSSGAIGWDSLRGRLTAWFHAPGGWTIRNAVIWRVRERIPTSQRYEVRQLTPGLQWVPAAGTRIDVQATRTWVAGPGGTLLGLERDGWEARANASVRLRESLDATALIELVDPDRAAPRTSGRLELRAGF